MAEDEALFDYVAADASGKRVKGQLAARSDTAAFERLKREGLSPIRIQPGRTGARASSDTAAPKSGRGLSERETGDFLSDLAALLGAGADMRGALSVLGARGGKANLRALSRALTAAISGGMALDQAFSTYLGRDHAFIGALVAAGEAAGDLAGGLQRGADMLASRLRLRDQLVSTLSYPAFVFASTVVAIGVILLFVAPSLAPLVEDAGSTPPMTLALMIGASHVLTDNLLLLGGLFGASVLGLFVLGQAGALTAPWERFLLDGPASRTAGALVFGGFAIAIGNMLAAGAPMSEALRLSIRSVRSQVARQRLEPVAQSVRQGELLSDALARVKPFPDAIVRLVAVGEASGALGPMLARAGKIEEDAAIRRIEAAGRVLGPALIVALGGMIGLLMAGLLSGVSQLGQSALQ
ncbi:MAG: type II secretion system F family protein [Caulobacteraceae bacterium]|nr:type II secretion system F family protein [Caulobacteraceae bacterium]